MQQQTSVISHAVVRGGEGWVAIARALRHHNTVDANGFLQYMTLTASSQRKHNMSLHASHDPHAIKDARTQQLTRQRVGGRTRAPCSLMQMLTLTLQARLRGAL